MIIAIASDHRGFAARQRIMPELKSQGHQIIDLGCPDDSACDYPDYALPVALTVARGQAEIGILLDGSGIGMTIAANKICGVRAALAQDEVTARRSREHHHCNVICLGTELLSEEQLRKIISTFISTPFGDGRHLRRIKKIAAIERDYACRHSGPAPADHP